MKRFLVATVLFANMLAATACQSSPAPTTAASPGAAPAASSVAATSGDEKGARELLSRFLAPNADTITLTKALQPTDADYEAVFDAASAAKAKAYYGKMWSSQKGGIGPKRGQTEVLIGSATTADLQAASPNAREFAGGWKKAAPHLKDGLTFYHFKFVEPGKTLGMSFDGLVFVNGHWAIFPKPWRALGES